MYLCLSTVLLVVVPQMPSYRRHRSYLLCTGLRFVTIVPQLQELVSRLSLIKQRVSFSFAKPLRGTSRNVSNSSSDILFRNDGTFYNLYWTFRIPKYLNLLAPTSQQYIPPTLKQAIICCDHPSGTHHMVWMLLSMEHLTVPYL